MPFRNEGEEPRETIRDFRRMKLPKTDLHFFAIDDGGEDGCCRDFGNAPDVTYMRNAQPLGQGICRSLGFLLCDADCYVSIDGHMRNKTRGGLERLCEDAIETEGIVTATSLARTESKPHYRHGQRWALDEEKPVRSACGMTRSGHTILGVQWNYGEKDPDMLLPIDIPQGACYAMTRETWKALGPNPERHNTHGMFDKWLAIAARFVGIPIYCRTGVMMEHLYRPHRPYRSNPLEWHYGYVQTMRTLFCDLNWKRYWFPLIQWMSDRVNDGKLQWLIHDDVLLEKHKNFAWRRVIVEKSVLSWMGIDDEKVAKWTATQ
jgi:hypothetical protein